MIQTVLGPVRPEDLGYCQCHEHLFVRKGKSFEINPAIYMDDLEKSSKELMLYKAAGGRSLVDAQPVGCGRMADYLAEASQISSVGIIASTGFHKLAFYYEGHWIRRLSEDELAELFASEIEHGMFVDGDDGLPSERSCFKAGIIKTALEGNGVAGRYRVLFSAAARVAARTGVPVMCHIEKGFDAFEVIRYLTDMKVKPERIILCHLDRAHYDPGFHKEVAQTGVFLEYDTIARPKYHNDEQEIELIRHMTGNGFSDQLLIGLDTTNQRLKSYGGAIGLDYIRTVFMNRMLQSGIPAEVIEKLVVENPRKALQAD
jgi:phosphotriesterase-related protein